MKDYKLSIRFSVLCAIIVATAFCRIVPHMPNFSPLGAIGLFGAAHFQKKWQAFLIPVMATWVSDLVLNNIVYAGYYSTFTWFYNGFYWQYGSYLLITFVGFFIFEKINVKRMIAGAFASTAIFFLISNFGCWVGSAFYPQNFKGLMICYTAGLPFLKGTFLGDLFYCGILFGGFALAQRKWAILRLNYM